MSRDTIKKMERFSPSVTTSPEKVSSHKLRIAFFASHKGTDMRAIIQAIQEGKLDGEPVLLISNNSGRNLTPDNSAMQYVHKQSPISFPTLHISNTSNGIEKTDQEVDLLIRKALEEQNVDVVVMCGYMKKVGPQTLAAFPGRVMNVHPALLPDLKGHWGDAIYDEVLTRRNAHPENPRNNWTGVTLHWADEEYDHGDHITQAGVKVTDSDTVDSLKGRIQCLEKIMYIQVLQDIAAGNILLPKKPEVVRK